MAMMTQIVDAGETEPRKLPHGWGAWHLTVLNEALKREGADLKQAFDPGYVFTQEHRFEDPEDGERITLHVGDTFRWWWS